MQTITQLFRTTRGGKEQAGRCEACNDVLNLDESNVCRECEGDGLLDEERDS